jgi:hypothetical protein
MTTRQARHERGREHNGGGIAPRAALLFNLGHRIEAVQYTRVAPAVLCLEQRRTEDKDGGESRDLVVAKLEVLLFAELSLSACAVLSPQFTQKVPTSAKTPPPDG